eukprot:TRINITY_DN11245_c0_g1_i1.p2 TRINITY_DN11245_c0_g1~~TRINITY_DN11245_c0_g1_i1.p2  ORF type:complete len:131 (-),score=15.62 TRINITY_DN11245_c0_g1_i1:108-443(-)
MAAGGAFGGQRQLPPRPPEKGIFPLDHFQECKRAAADYLKCLKQNDKMTEFCTEETKKYLLCRMNNNLMGKQDLKELGFDDSRPKLDVEVKRDQSLKRAQRGFQPGLRFVD